MDGLKVSLQALVDRLDGLIRQRNRSYGPEISIPRLARTITISRDARQFLELFVQSQSSAESSGTRSITSRERKVGEREEVLDDRDNSLAKRKRELTNLERSLDIRKRDLDDREAGLDRRQSQLQASSRALSRIADEYDAHPNPGMNHRATTREPPTRHRADRQRSTPFFEILPSRSRSCMVRERVQVSEYHDERFQHLRGLRSAEFWDDPDEYLDRVVLCDCADDAPMRHTTLLSTTRCWSRGGGGLIVGCGMSVSEWMGSRCGGCWSIDGLEADRHSHGPQ